MSHAKIDMGSWALAPLSATKVAPAFRNKAIPLPRTIVAEAIGSEWTAKLIDHKREVPNRAASIAGQLEVLEELHLPPRRERCRPGSRRRQVIGVYGELVATVRRRTRIKVKGNVMISAKPFDFPYDGNLLPSATALLVIDLQEDFLSISGYFARRGYDPSPLRAILPTVNRLIKAARSTGMHIIFTRQGYRADMADMTPYEKWRRARAGLEGTDILLRSGAGFQIVPEIDVAPGDIIVDKTCNGAFTYTDFEHVLRSQGITHLLLTGCTTDVCVHTTLREACDRNFQCLTISDACASGDQWAHEAALHMVTVENGIFGALAGSGAVLEALANLPAKYP